MVLWDLRQLQDILDFWLSKYRNGATSWRPPSPGFTAAGNGCCPLSSDAGAQARVQQSTTLELESNARARGRSVGFVLMAPAGNLSGSWNISRHDNACATKLLRCTLAQLWAVPANTSQTSPKRCLGVSVARNHSKHAGCMQPLGFGGKGYLMLWT